ncbi:MAG: hypothetical protein ACR2KD_04220 [Thermoleophilaceae bacterium]|jgi:CheY-like chemotaxis protein|nr:hypothetical protein [Thermoleophilaceae bacterium]
MPRIAVLCPDLLFGSRIEGTLGAAGHAVERFGDGAAVRAATPGSDLLVVDLTTDDVERCAMVASMRTGGELDGVPALGFYSHVEVDVRRRAEEAGFDMVVPRSRMAREMPALVERLTGGGHSPPDATTL